MIFKQYYLACLAHASYLLGDETTRGAVLVDPRRDIDEYLADAKALGLEIRHVFLTHFHADFLAGHLELQRRTGATIHLGAKADADFGFRRMQDGERLEFPSFAIQVLETPGHTPESISLVVTDFAKDREKPWAVLTGDALFVGDVGRPDLLASIGFTSEELAKMLYHSLHEKLMKLDDQTLVYPAHGAGSMCGKSLGSENVSSIGKERASNYALKPMSEADFIALVTADQPIAPAYFSFDALQNRREYDALDDVKKRALKRISYDKLRELEANEPLQLLDVRDAEPFAAGHLTGSWNVPLDGRFATWAGSLLDPERPIALIVPAGQEEEAVVRLSRIGFDKVIGYLVADWAQSEVPAARIQKSVRLDVAGLERRMAEANPPLLVDVRGPSEVEAGHIDGVFAIPLQQLKARLGEIPFDREVVFLCRTGYRSSVAASLFRAARGEDAEDLAGGMVAWEKTHALTAGA